MKNALLAGGFALLAAVSLAGTPAPAADFYKNKDITLYVAASPGGGYAVYARALSRHWGNHIPGKPGFVVKHKMGAQGLVAASYLANAARRDGTELLASYREAVTTTPLYITQGVHFNPADLSYIGSADQGFGLCVANKSAGVKSLDDVKTKPVKLGATHHRSLGYSAAYLMNNLLDTKFQVYHGYPAGSAIVLALERNEVEARCGWSVSSLMTMKPEWLTGGPVNILVQLSLESHPDLKHVPLLGSYVKNEDDRKLLKLVLAPQTAGRPYVGPPELPAERLKALRASFAATLKDKNFLKDAEKQRIDINPLSGEALAALVKDLHETPKPLIQRALDVTTKSDKVTLVKVKIPWKTEKVKVVDVKKKGRRIGFKSDGDDVTVSVSGSKSKVSIDGKAAKRSAIKAGMTCTVTHQGDRTTAKTIACN
ncbi:MAG: Bug family tripartite tricarboxylate transporter substrate binding protein [Alphaproteobacteria bacterium]